MSHASAPRATYRDSAASIRTGHPPRLPALGTLGLLALALSLAIAAADPDVGRFRVLPAAAAPAESRRPAAVRGLADDAPLIQPAALLGGVLRIVAPTGTVAWLAQGRRVWAVDLADPQQPRDLGPGLRFEGEVDALAVDGSLGLAAVGMDLWALNLAAVTTPKLGGRLTLQRPLGHADAWVERVLLYSGTAYVKITWGQGKDGRVAVVDLRRPAQPELAPAAFLAIPEGTAVGDLVSIGPALAVLRYSPEAPGGSHDEVLVFDLSMPRAPSPVATIEAGTATRGRSARLAARSTSEGSRLVMVGGAGADSERLSIVEWSLADPASPRVVLETGVRRGGHCFRELRDVTFAADGGLYVSCVDGGGFFDVGESIVRAEPGGTMEPVARSDGLTSPLSTSGSLLLVGSVEGLLIHDLARGTTSAYPVLGAVARLETTRLEGSPVLVVPDHGLKSLDLSDPVHPKPLGTIAGSKVLAFTLDEGLACQGAWGGLDRPFKPIIVTDLSDPRAMRTVGTIEVPESGDLLRPLLMAQSGHLLAVSTGSADGRLHRLARDAEPRQVGAFSAPGHTLIALAMTGGLLATLSQEAPALGTDGVAPLILALFALEDRGDEVQTRLVVQRTLASEAWGDPSATHLLITPDWLVVSLGLGCGQGREHGVMMLQLEPGRDEASLNRYLWIPRTGNALLLHDGFLFVEEPGWISALDIRQVADRPWAWREAARLAATAPLAMAALDHTLYVSTGSSGVAIFQPDLPWASDPKVPTPTAPPNPPPVTPTQPSTPCLSPTPTATASASASPSQTPSATRTVRGSATPTKAPGRGLWLPLVGGG